MKGMVQLMNNPNLDLLMEKIFDDEKIVDEIMATDDMHDLYAICQKIQGGYTFEEFCEFFDSLVCMCLDETKEAIAESGYEIDELSEKDLKQISGGATGFKRGVASAMASLSFMTSAHIYAKDLYGVNSDISIISSDSSKTEDETNSDPDKKDEKNNDPDKKDETNSDPDKKENDVPLHSSEDDDPEETESFKAKVKKFFDKAADVVWDNKGKILLGSIALLVGGSLLVHDHEQIGDNIKAVFERKNQIKNYEKNRDKSEKEWRKPYEKGKDESDKDYEQRLKNQEVLPKGWNIDEEKEDRKSEIEGYIDKKVAEDQKDAKVYNPRMDDVVKSVKLEHQSSSPAEILDMAKNMHSEYLADYNAAKAEYEQHKKDSVKDILKKDLPVVGGLIGVGGAVGSAVKGILDTIGTLKKGKDDINAIVQNAQEIDIIQQDIEKKWERKKQIENAKNYDPVQAEKELERFFKNDFQGQEKAKDQIRDFFTSYSTEREAGKNNLTESELPSPKVLVFNGPSGTGKSYMAKELSKVLTGEGGLTPYMLTANNIKQCAKSQYLGYADAFMYGNMKMDNKASSGNYLPSDNLFNYLKETQGTVRVVVLDEWDKLYEKQDGKYPEKHPLDEMFRDILDGTLKDWYGNEVDLSGTIFICTTNETKASIQGRIKVSETGRLVEVVADEKGHPILKKNEYDEDEYIYKTPSKDDNSQTVIPHDPSCMNRVSNVCYFDGLQEESFEDIARRAIEDVRNIASVNEYKKYINSEKHKGKQIEVLLFERMMHPGLDGVIISDEGYKTIAKCASDASNAARFIVGSGKDATGSVCGNLKSAIEKHCTSIKSSKKSYKGLTLLAKPYEDTDSTGKTVVRFEIENLGYDGYDKYLKEVNGK